MGFRSYETVSVPNAAHIAKGFHRSIFIFRKAAPESTPVTTSSVSTNVEPKTFEEACEKRRQIAVNPDYLINYDRDLFPTETR